MPQSISQLAQALSLFKANQGPTRGATTGQQVAAASGHMPIAAAQQATAQALQGLRTQVRAARGPDGKLPPGKALRLYVQAALLDELGSGLQLDPALGDLVERTCVAIEQDGGSAALLADALRELEAMAD